MSTLPEDDPPTEAEVYEEYLRWRRAKNTLHYRIGSIGTMDPPLFVVEPLVNRTWFFKMPGGGPGKLNISASSPQEFYHLVQTKLDPQASGLRPNAISILRQLKQHLLHR